MSAGQDCELSAEIDPLNPSHGFTPGARQCPTLKRGTAAS